MHKIYYEWLEEMNRAVAEKDAVDAANKPFRDENRRVLAENERVHRENEAIALINQVRDREGLPLLPPAGWIKKRVFGHHAVGRESARILDREFLLRRFLERRTGGEWARKIVQLTDPAVRRGVAGIVWWDFFGSRNRQDRWPDLDVFLEEPFFEAPDEELKAGLWRVGYSPYMCERRFCQTKGRGRRS